MGQPSQRIASKVSSELSGEHVLWAGRPEKWSYARRYWVFSIVGLPFTAFSIFWTRAVVLSFFGFESTSDHVGAWLSALFIPIGLTLISVGMAFILLPLRKAMRAKDIYYVVTERRAVIFEQSRRFRVHSFDLSGFGGFERVTHGGGTSDILFQRMIERRRKGVSVMEVGFIGLEKWAEAEDALREMMCNRGKA
jgi:hypothetical protein